MSLAPQSSLVSTLNRGGYTPSISLFTLHSWALTPSVSLTVHSRALRTEGKHSLSFFYSSLLGTLNGEGNAPSLSLSHWALGMEGWGKHSLSTFHSLLLGILNRGGNTPSVSLVLHPGWMVELPQSFSLYTPEWRRTFPQSFSLFTSGHFEQKGEHSLSLSHSSRLGTLKMEMKHSLSPFTPGHSERKTGTLSQSSLLGSCSEVDQGMSRTTGDDSY